MATKWIDLIGTIKWAQVYEPDEYLGIKRWKLTFYPETGGDWDKITKSGLGLKIKEDDDGRYLQFRRPVEKKIKDKIVIFTPPRITGAVNVQYVNAETGEMVRSYDQGTIETIRRDGETVLLGNGTKVKVNVCVYDTQVGKGHRLESIHVYDLVEYDGPEEVDEEAPPEVEAPVADAPDAPAPW